MPLTAAAHIAFTSACAACQKAVQLLHMSLHTGTSGGRAFASRASALPSGAAGRLLAAEAAACLLARCCRAASRCRPSSASWPCRTRNDITRPSALCMYQHCDAACVILLAWGGLHQLLAEGEQGLCLQRGQAGGTCGAAYGTVGICSLLHRQVCAQLCQPLSCLRLLLLSHPPRPRNQWSEHRRRQPYNLVWSSTQYLAWAACLPCKQCHFQRLECDHT